MSEMPQDPIKGERPDGTIGLGYPERRADGQREGLWWARRNPNIPDDPERPRRTKGRRSTDTIPSR